MNFFSAICQVISFRYSLGNMLFMLSFQDCWYVVFLFSHFLARTFFSIEVIIFFKLGSFCLSHAMQDIRWSTLFMGLPWRRKDDLWLSKLCSRKTQVTHLLVYLMSIIPPKKKICVVYGIFIWKLMFMNETLYMYH